MCVVCLEGVVFMFSLSVDKSLGFGKGVTEDVYSLSKSLWLVVWASIGPVVTVWDCSGLESKSFGAVGKAFLPIASGLVGSCGWYCDDGCRRSKALCLWCFDVAVLGDRRKDGFNDKKARTPRLSPLNYGSGTEDDGSIPVGVFADKGISREEDFKYCL